MHVASVIAQMAPGANVIIVRTHDRLGNDGDLTGALEWISDNAEQYNIVAVNMSWGNQPGTIYSTPQTPTSNTETDPIYD